MCALCSPGSALDFGRIFCKIEINLTILLFLCPLATRPMPRRTIVATIEEVGRGAGGLGMTGVAQSSKVERRALSMELRAWWSERDPTFRSGVSEP